MAAKHTEDSEQTKRTPRFSQPATRKRAGHSLKNKPQILPGFENANIRFLDAESLSRTQTMPSIVIAILIVALVVASFIGVVIIYWYSDSVLNAQAKEQDAIEESLTREVSRDVPDLMSFVQMSDEEIMDTLRSTGATLYERTAVGTSEEGGFEVIKLPDDVTIDDAVLMYTNGINNLSAPDAVNLLNGSWDLTVSREAGTNIHLGYADFSANSLGAAVQSAINASGLGHEEILESGEDSSGNTYATGTFEVDEDIFTWRVSVVPLSDMYSISSLPTSSYYVGIRITD